MKKVIVFGVGSDLKKLINRDLLSNCDIVAFCDNDKSKWGKLYRNIEIISPKRINDIQYDEIIISTEKYESEIREQLQRDYDISNSVIKSVMIPREKYEGELDYWKEKFEEEGKRFSNLHYKNLMLSIAQEEDDSFWKNKVVADFGCGPRGSLCWTKSPLMKIGIDVLANRYLQEFGDTLVQHNMTYVTSSESYIPVQNESVDYLFTINSLDHVNNLDDICEELLRILKPSGMLLASFNLNQPSTECEPQTLTEENLREKLLKYFDIESYRLAYRGNSYEYENLENNCLIDSITNNQEAILWVRGKKK